MKVHKENPKVISRDKNYEREEEPSQNLGYLLISFLKGLTTGKWEFKFTWKF